MTEPQTDVTPNQDGNGVAAPYVSFLTLRNTVEKMAKEGGVPSQVDRSYLNNLPGSTQTQLMAAMKWLGLIDNDLKPTGKLEELVENESERPQLVKAILEEHYPGPLALGGFATQQQLEDHFRKLGVSGSTLRKAVAFFLSAAKFADIGLSPHFRTPKVTASAGAKRKARAEEPQPATSSQPTARPTRAHHPLIEGLIQELPPPGAAFPKTKQEDWLELARVTFRMIYKADEPLITDFAPRTKEVESD